MKRNSDYIFFAIFLLSVLGFSCKKQVFDSAQPFTTIHISDQSGIVGLKLSYNDDPYLIYDGGRGYVAGNLNDFKVPAGTGKFSFIDPVTDEPLLDTTLTIKADSTYDLILFKPGEDAPLVLLTNTQQNEPHPEAGYMKIKLANFASTALPNAIDIVFYGLDANTWEYVPLDTLKDAARQFPGEYITLKTATSPDDPSLLAKIVDSESQEILTDNWLFVDNFDWNTYEFFTVFTVFLTTDDANGVIVNGSSHKVLLKTLFAN